MARRRATPIGTPAERAANGAKFLDTHVPDWYRKVKVPVLDIGSYRNCIIAQLDGVFSLEWLIQFGAPEQEDDLLMFGTLHGFRMNMGLDREDLTLAWATEIAARVDKAKAAAKVAKAAAKAAEVEADEEE
jgi:hypothetical protein